MDMPTRKALPCAHNAFHFLCLRCCLFFRTNFCKAINLSRLRGRGDTIFCQISSQDKESSVSIIHLIHSNLMSMLAAERCLALPEMIGKILSFLDRNNQIDCLCINSTWCDPPSGTSSTVY